MENLREHHENFSKKKTLKASVFMSFQNWPVLGTVHSHDFSRRKMGKLKTDLSFSQKIKVVGFNEIYNFCEDNFFKI